MSDDTKRQPTPADLARELIRRLDVQTRLSNEMLLNLASIQAADYAFTHARTIAEALLAAEAVIAKHALCHDLHGKVGRDEFEEGCRRETVKEFGSCGWADKLAAAEARVAKLEAACEKALMVIPGISAWSPSFATSRDNAELELIAVETLRAVLAKGKGTTQS